MNEVLESKEIYDTENGKFKVKIIEPIKYGLNYSFDVGIAKLYGVNEAIFINNLIYWTIQNKANNKNYNDGYYWTYNSVRAFSDIFPFWTSQQLRTIINNLENKNIIKSGNYNKIGYDRTKWYAIIDESICYNWQLYLLESTNGFIENNKPIPLLNTVNKQDNKTDTEPTLKSELDNQVNELYNLYPATDKNNNIRSTNKSLKDKVKIKKLIKSMGYDILKQTFDYYLADYFNKKQWISNLSVFLNNLPDINEFKKAVVNEPIIKDISVDYDKTDYSIYKDR